MELINLATSSRPKGRGFRVVGSYWEGVITSSLLSYGSMALYLNKEISIVGAIGFTPVLARTGIGKYYRATVPREVRGLLELGENDEVKYVFENRTIYVRKGQR